MDKQVIVEIAGRKIGAGEPCFLIAEAGVNHNGDVALGHRLIDAAVKSGADAVKFQAFVTSELVTAAAAKAGYQEVTTGRGESQETMLKALELTPAHHDELITHCRAAGIQYLCTPYDSISAAMLDRLDVPAFKIASTDTTNIPLLDIVARMQRPIILSTGMCDLAEINEAVTTVKSTNDWLILLHCTSEYPAAVTETNLRAMTTLGKAFACPVGYSDHTDGIEVAPWAVALGASVLEKHFTLDRTLKGPDHRASIEPEEFEHLVRAVRNLESAMGDGVKRPTQGELLNKPRMQRSLVAARDIPAGTALRPDDIACKRPATGLTPNWYSHLLGRRTRTAISRDALLTLEMFESRGPVEPGR